MVLCLGVGTAVRMVSKGGSWVAAGASSGDAVMAWRAASWLHSPCGCGAAEHGLFWSCQFGSGLLLYGASVLNCCMGGRTANSCSGEEQRLSLCLKREVTSGEVSGF